MPAQSEAQRKLMGMALRYKRGELSRPSAEVKKVAGSMKESQLHDFAKKPGHHATPMRYHKPK